MNEQQGDPYAKGGSRHWFWFADATYIAAGVYWRRHRVLPLSQWILRPRYSWRTRRYT